jgi:hypothetical protein
MPVIDFHALNPTVDQLIRRISRDLLLPVFSRGIAQSLICYKQDNSVVTKIDIEAQEIFETALHCFTARLVRRRRGKQRPQAGCRCSSRNILIAGLSMRSTARTALSQASPISRRWSVCATAIRRFTAGFTCPTEDRMFAGGVGIGVLRQRQADERPTHAQKDVHDMIGTISAGLVQARLRTRSSAIAAPFMGCATICAPVINSQGC